MCSRYFRLPTERPSPEEEAEALEYFRYGVVGWSILAALLGALLALAICAQMPKNLTRSCVLMMLFGTVFATIAAVIACRLGRSRPWIAVAGNVVFSLLAIGLFLYRVANAFFGVTIS